MDKNERNHRPSSKKLYLDVYSFSETYMKDSLLFTKLTLLVKHPSKQREAEKNYKISLDWRRKTNIR